MTDNVFPFQTPSLYSGRSSRWKAVPDAERVQSVVDNATSDHLPPHNGLSILLQDPSGARQGRFSSQAPPRDMFSVVIVNTTLSTSGTFVGYESASYAEGIQTEACLILVETELVLEVLGASYADHGVIRRNPSPSLVLEQCEVVKS